MRVYIVTYRPIARQRPGKHIPAEAYARSNRASIAKQLISKQISTIKRLCFLRGPSRGVISYKEGRLKKLLSRIGSSSGVGRRWLRRNGKKWIRLWKENFMCYLKWQWDGSKSVGSIRLVKTENPSACVSLNCKVCKSAIALYCL
jgi:hypothetical protein